MKTKEEILLEEQRINKLLARLKEWQKRRKGSELSDAEILRLKQPKNIKVFT